MDFEKLQGIWRNGAATTTITGDRFTTAQMGTEYGGRVEINEAAAPKTLSLHFETGPEAGNSNHGIYEFVGDDWRFCLNMTGGPAPKEFAPSPLRGIALETMVRREAAGTAPCQRARGGVAGRVGHGLLRPRRRTPSRLVGQARQADHLGLALHALFRPPVDHAGDVEQ